MAKQLLSSYTFTPGAANAGTVVVPGSYTLEQFLLITNVTSGTILYQFNVPSKGAVLTTGGGNTTLTLEFSTQSMSAADRLQVFIDDVAATVLPCQSPATPAAGTIKASAGRLLGYQLTNTSAGWRYVKLFNATTPTLGTTAALIEIAIPAGSTTQQAITSGMAFSTAITHTVTSGKGLTDNTSSGLASSDVVGWFAFA
jgi:hypothetical protein